MINRLKKAAFIFTFLVGLILLGLNHYRNSNIELTSQLNPKISTPEIKKVEESDKSFDVNWINLPSIFDALIRGLKN